MNEDEQFNKEVSEESPNKDANTEIVKEKKSLNKEKLPKKPGLITKLKEKLMQYKRTINVSRKPGKEEFLASIKITGIGILLLGFIGFIIYMIYHLVW